MRSNYFPVHAHSHYSVLDGMSPVPRMVDKVAKMGQPGFVLSDHGNMAGAVKLYKACKTHGIKPYPAIEAYLLDPTYDGSLDDKEAAKVGRYHLGLMALTERGYMGLVAFTSMTHTRPRFSRFARATLSDLAKLGQEFGDDIALSTGCFFGWVQQTLIYEGDDQARRALRMLRGWFPHTFVEVQHHNIVHEPEEDEAQNFVTDDAIVDALVSMADDFGLPVIAGQDNHYTDQAERRAHSLMKRMTYGNDNEFPGDTFHLASAEWMREHYSDDVWARIEDGHGALLDLHDLHIKPLDNYSIDVPATPGVKKPKSKVLSAVNQFLDDYTVSLPSRKRQAYYDRAAFEEDIIDHLGMWSYFTIWQNMVEWCRHEHIAIEARGSANGFLVCFALGITQVDPIKWNLDPERFLSKDRTKPPDIDMDVEDVHRDRVIAKMHDMFGDAVQIGTWSQLGITKDKETGEDKGSVLQSWIQSRRRMCEEEAWLAEQDRAANCAAGKCTCAGKCIGTKPVKYRAIDAGRMKFGRKYGWIKTMREVQRVAPHDYVGLMRLASMNSVYRSYGVHPAGVLLSGDNTLIEDYIPTMLVASSDTTVTQYEQDDCEEFGLLKMDWLGQTTLTIMRKCQAMIGRQDPTDFTWIPENDRKALKVLRTGRTDTGIFHFEGYTKARGGKELGVKSVADCVLVQALYMPGCMDIAPGQKVSQKDLYLRLRRDPDARRRVRYLHDAFEKALSETYGAVVFQEQVINIMRNLGMGIEGINKFFKVVKDSGKGAIERNQQRMAEVRSEFDSLCAKAGIDSDEAWNQTAAFVAYGFNRSHATGYGIRSYRCAYLKTHYPLEFMTALLQCWAGEKKEKVYAREARRMDIPLLPPDINVSGNTWTIDRKREAIRRGLVSVDGVGDSTAAVIARHAPYKSVRDLCERANFSGTKKWLTGGGYTGALAKLRDAGVLKRLEEDHEPDQGRVA